MNSAAQRNGSARTLIVVTMTLQCPAAIATVAMKFLLEQVAVEAQAETTMMMVLRKKATPTVDRVVAAVLGVALTAEMVTVEMGAAEVVAAEADGVAIAVVDVAVKLALLLLVRYFECVGHTNIALIWAAG